MMGDSYKEGKTTMKNYNSQDIFEYKNEIYRILVRDGDRIVAKNITKSIEKHETTPDCIVTFDAKNIAGIKNISDE